MEFFKKYRRYTVLGAGVIAFFALVFLNPFAWNDGGNRTVVTTFTGDQFVQFTPGLYWQGFFAKETVWPNQISVTYQQDKPDLDLEDNGIEIGKVIVRFGGDATTANVSGITQYVLPTNEKEMILIHNTHRTPESLVAKRLAAYTKECLQSSAQLMSSEKHYSGGRAQMAQDFKDQLQYGVYLLTTKDGVVYDTLEKENKRVYFTEIVKDKNGTATRKQSSLSEYGVTVADAAITDVDYEPQVDEKLKRIIEASTRSAISKQELMTAQQQALTAKAKGEQALVEIEYTTKQEQTKQVVEAQTEVEVAKQDKLKQQIAYEAAILEAKKIKELADAEAYQKAKVMQADGALDKKLDAWLKAEEAKWNAFSKFQGQLVPAVQTGGGTGANGIDWLQIMGAKAAKDLALDVNPGK